MLGSTTHCDEAKHTSLPPLQCPDARPHLDDVTVLNRPVKTWKHVGATGWHFVVGSVLMAGTNLCLSSAFMSTSAANALVLFSLQPLWAAGFAWLWLRERIPFRTVVAIVVGVLCAVAVFVGASTEAVDAVQEEVDPALGMVISTPSTVGATITSATPAAAARTVAPVSSTASDVTASTRTGDLLALAAGICFSGYLTVCRAVAKQRRV